MPSIDATGRVVFMAETSAGRQILLHDGSQLIEIAREGGPSPLAGVTYAALERPMISQQGDVVFTADLASPTVPFALLRWRPATGVVEALKKTGDPITNFQVMDAYFSGFKKAVNLMAPTPSVPHTPFVVNDENVGFNFTYKAPPDCGNPDSNGTFGCDPGAPVVLQTGEGYYRIAPTAGSMSINNRATPGVGQEEFGTPTMNINGEASLYYTDNIGAFRIQAKNAAIENMPGTPLVAQGFVLEGDDAPGAPGATFSSLNFDPVVNNAGKVSFYAKTNNDNSGGIWSTQMGTTDAMFANLHLEVGSGATAPGTTEVITTIDPDCLTDPTIITFTRNCLISQSVTAQFSGFGDPALTHDGNEVFLAYLQGPAVGSNDDFAIYAQQGTQFALVAREGSSAPGGGVFSRSVGDPNLQNSPFLDPHADASGQVAFQAYVDGGTAGVWTWNPSTSGGGALSQVVRDGQLVFVIGAQQTTLGDIRFGYQDRAFSGHSKGLNTGNEDGRQSFFNNQGAVVFRADSPMNSTSPIHGTWIIVANPLVSVGGPTGTLASQTAGDVNGDGRVGADDLLQVLQSIGASSGATDANGDARVDSKDIAVVLRNWGM